MANDKTPDLTQLSKEMEQLTADVQRLNSAVLAKQGEWMEAQKVSEIAWGDFQRTQKELMDKMAALYRARAQFANITTSVQQSLGKKLQA